MPVSPLAILHNAFHANGGSGISVGSSVSGLDVRNNVFSTNGAWGILATGAAAFSAFEPNGFHANGAGALSFATPGPANVIGDPRWIDASSGTFRLRNDSPCPNRGVDTGLDVNGALPGRFNAAAPDHGAHETAY